VSNGDAGGVAGTSAATGAGGVTGLVVVDKEAGWTSHDVVARCRGIFGQRRVGHAGTLDPDATGVLLVGLGRATRLMRFLTPLPKTYTTDIVLGTATSTLDASGEVIATYDMSHVTPDDVATAAAWLTGFDPGSRPGSGSRLPVTTPRPGTPPRSPRAPRAPRSLRSNLAGRAATPPPGSPPQWRGRP